MKTDQITHFLPGRVSTGSKGGDAIAVQSNAPSVLDIARMHEADKQRLLEHLLTNRQLDYLDGKDLTRLRFYRRQDSEVVFIDIINRDTGSVIKTYPEPELVEIFSKLRQTTGLLIDVNG